MVAVHIPLLAQFENKRGEVFRNLWIRVRTREMRERCNHHALRFKLLGTLFEVPAQTSRHYLGITFFNLEKHDQALFHALGDESLFQRSWRTFAGVIIGAKPLFRLAISDTG